MLRKLQQKDAGRMHEWMHDDVVLRGLQPEVFKKKTIEDCRNFIDHCQDQTTDCHMAIVDENDIYQGTVSLKMIDHEVGDCEFAIVLRQDAFGKGFGKSAMIEIMEIAFKEYGLSEVYWNVLANNAPAISLYDRIGCKELEEVTDRRRDRGPRKSDGSLEEVKFYHVTPEMKLG